MNEKEISAGAEKVEAIERAREERARAAQEAFAREEGLYGADGMPARSEENAARQGEAACGGAKEAARRQEAARKQARQRAAEAESRRAARRVEAAKRKEERARKSAEGKAARAQKEPAAERRSEKRGRGGEHKRAPGFGGWLAAVVSLSVAVLALGAIVTVGYFDLQNSKTELAATYRAHACSLCEHVGSLGTALAKARLADGGYELQKLLAEARVYSELAEADLAALPCDGHETAELSAYFNRVSAFSRHALNTLAAGRSLGDRAAEAVEHFYGTSEKVRAALPALAESTEGGLSALADAEGGFVRALRALDAAARSERPRPQPRENMLSSMPALSEEQAAERANSWFADYRPRELRVAGKTEGPFACYDVQFVSEAGDAYTARITERGGMLAMLESYRPCSQKNFDLSAAETIASAFLERCGYAGMAPVWVSESGSEADVQFAYEQGGVLVYPDRITVKVCTERGIVTGMEAGGFLRCHHARTLPAPAVPRGRVEENAAAKMDEVRGIRLAVIPEGGEERLVYEVHGDHGGRTYFAYVDAQTGVLCDIRVVSPSDRGNILR